MLIYNRFAWHTCILHFSTTKNNQNFHPINQTRHAIVQLLLKQALGTVKTSIEEVCCRYHDQLWQLHYVCHHPCEAYLATHIPDIGMSKECLPRIACHVIPTRSHPKEKTPTRARDQKKPMDQKQKDSRDQLGINKKAGPYFVTDFLRLFG